ncbi:effector binding domain-containing protein [Lacticaseibacillus songhuajiangensis]|uniref:effector binding domain-containing protein n=1 Tax=Lacticaseibacillus songhuajiangensis TaxID=1296539 RepID=UPI000F76BBF6|nr:effector binding domain-containing protein [Lacticaseibacillus songhuajiangensis]
MTNYTIATQPAFSILGIGTELKSHYTDFAGMAAEKSAFWNAVQADGRLEELQAIAADNKLFFVNEAYQNKMMYYVAVRSDKDFASADRRIEFPAGEYVLVDGTGADAYSAAEGVIGAAFGGVLGQLSDVAYVGGPNAAAVEAQTDGTYAAKMYIPVVRN